MEGKRMSDKFEASNAATMYFRRADYAADPAYQMSEDGFEEDGFTPGELFLWTPLALRELSGKLVTLAAEMEKEQSQL
jgi:hypothetical protein